MMMFLATNAVAAGLLAAAVLFYVFVYTVWLKRRTPQNIVIGGAAGAFPPAIGWAVVTGNVGIEAVILFALIFGRRHTSGHWLFIGQRLRGCRRADAAGNSRRGRRSGS